MTVTPLLAALWKPSARLVLRWRSEYVANTTAQSIRGLSELTIPPTDTARMEGAVLQSMLMEWRLQRGSAPLQFVAITRNSCCTANSFDSMGIVPRSVTRRN